MVFPISTLEKVHRRKKRTKATPNRLENVVRADKWRRSTSKYVTEFSDQSTKGQVSDPSAAKRTTPDPARMNTLVKKLFCMFGRCPFLRALTVPGGGVL